MLGRSLATGTVAALALTYWCQPAQAADPVAFRLALNGAAETQRLGGGAAAGGLVIDKGNPADADTLPVWCRRWGGWGWGGGWGGGWGCYRPYSSYYYYPSYYYSAPVYSYYYRPYYYAPPVYYYTPSFYYAPIGGAASATFSLNIGPRVVAAAPTPAPAPAPEAAPSTTERYYRYDSTPYAAPPASNGNGNGNGNGTYRYDGGPQSPVPMPRNDDARPTTVPAPAPAISVPLEGRAVSLPSRTTSPYTYRAYGEAPAPTAPSRDTTVLVKQK